MKLKASETVGPTSSENDHSMRNRDVFLCVCVYSTVPLWRWKPLCLVVNMTYHKWKEVSVSRLVKLSHFHDTEMSFHSDGKNWAQQYKIKWSTYDAAVIK